MNLPQLPVLKDGVVIPDGLYQPFGVYIDGVEIDAVRSIIGALIDGRLMAKMTVLVGRVPLLNDQRDYPLEASFVVSANRVTFRSIAS